MLAGSQDSAMQPGVVRKAAMRAEERADGVVWGSAKLMELCGNLPNQARIRRRCFGTEL